MFGAIIPAIRVTCKRDELHHFEYCNCDRNYNYLIWKVSEEEYINGNHFPPGIGRIHNIRKRLKIYIILPYGHEDYVMKWKDSLQNHDCRFMCMAKYDNLADISKLIRLEIYAEHQEKITKMNNIFYNCFTPIVYASPFIVTFGILYIFKFIQNINIFIRSYYFIVVFYPFFFET